MQKKKIILLIALILIIIGIIVLTLSKTKQITPIQETATAEYTTTIGETKYDITNLVLKPSEIVPTLSAGMIPIKWNGPQWVITTKNDSDWYNYEESKPAYIMLNDGYYKSELERGVTEEQLMQNSVGNDALVVPGIENNNPSIYMYIPRFAYNNDGQILYIKQGCSVVGSYTIPEIFTYETDKRDFSLAGVWVECNPLANTNAVDAKVSNMNGENNTYGFIANTIATNANNETSYNTMIETFIVNINNESSRTPTHTNNNPTNQNRTILKIVNTNKLEPIRGTATLNEEELTITINVTYNENEISKIINTDGKILSENSNTATDTELLGNGIYEYIVVDYLGNLKAITIKVEGLKIYVIPNLKRLKEFRDEVNAGNKFNGITVIQTADIAMNEGKYTIDEESGEVNFTEDAEQWVPIGDYSTNAQLRFYGEYDGRGHTISGIYINSESKYQGLFGYANSATIKNLGIENSKMVSTGNYIGSIAGYAVGGCNIENCFNSGKVTGNRYVGGLFGILDGDISNCYNTGNIKSIDDVGGLSGECSGNISNCYNIGEVISTGYRVGGVFGNYSGNITNCYNVGSVTGKQDVGGIIGLGSLSTMNISKLFNSGEISSDRETGGILRRWS